MVARRQQVIIYQYTLLNGTAKFFDLNFAVPFFFIFWYMKYKGCCTAQTRAAFQEQSYTNIHFISALTNFSYR
jgi:hypothetical protein